MTEPRSPKPSVATSSTVISAYGNRTPVDENTVNSVTSNPDPSNPVSPARSERVKSSQFSKQSTEDGDDSTRRDASPISGEGENPVRSETGTPKPPHIREMSIDEEPVQLAGGSQVDGFPATKSIHNNGAKGDILEVDSDDTDGDTEVRTNAEYLRIRGKPVNSHRSGVLSEENIPAGSGPLPFPEGSVRVSMTSTKRKRPTLPTYESSDEGEEEPGEYDEDQGTLSEEEDIRTITAEKKFSVDGDVRIVEGLKNAGKEEKERGYRAPRMRRTAKRAKKRMKRGKSPCDLKPTDEGKTC
ncbi:hypothetical protein QFC22_005899 [Naganishia vaughanmartiniae]|uniref:Uncharacterized protein n=1 Tax=Naganishia vaughanmartiniae TaxID=1424756 RepID=A0ACC2WSC6_9TREE|nr:hypothetical protein QFC22_005899 [Naganishia vaughanmartiniae]